MIFEKVGVVSQRESLESSGSSSALWYPVFLMCNPPSPQLQVPRQVKAQDIIMIPAFKVDDHFYAECESFC